MGCDLWSTHEKFFFFLVIPLILAIIYLLPLDVKDAYFILHKTNFSILSMFLSNYTHSDFMHLAENLIAYLLVMCLIIKFETNKSNFYKTACFLFLILPFIISAFTLHFIPTQNAFGFSGIVVGLFGYFVYVTYGYIKDVWKLNADISFIYLIFCINAFIGVRSWLVNDLTYLALILLILVSLILFYYNCFLIKDIIHLLKLKIQQGLSTCGLLTFILAVVVLFCSLPLLIQVTFENGNLTNALAHYIGYIFGVFFPVIFLETKIWK